jgi:hypothetical protein
MPTSSPDPFTLDAPLFKHQTALQPVAFFDIATSHCKQTPLRPTHISISHAYITSRLVACPSFVRSGLSAPPSTAVDTHLAKENNLPIIGSRPTDSRGQQERGSKSSVRILQALESRSCLREISIHHRAGTSVSCRQSARRVGGGSFDFVVVLRRNGGAP